MPRKYSDHEKEKGCWFICVCSKVELRDKIKQNCKEFPFWGWVDHQPDVGDEEEDKHFHTHYIIRTAGTRSIKQVADILGQSGNFIQVCRNKRSQMRYFRHLDDPNKVQYDESAIHSNRMSTFRVAWEDNQDDDVRRTFYDLNRLRMHTITPDQFLDLHFLELQKMPFYQKIKTYELIEKLFTTGSEQLKSVRRTT